jgi:hypothetical protein
MKLQIKQYQKNYRNSPTRSFRKAYIMNSLREKKQKKDEEEEEEEEEQEI